MEISVVKSVVKSAAKEELRQEARRRVRALSPEEVAQNTKRIVQRCLSLPEVTGASRVFTCLSFGLEVDTWTLVDRLAAEGKEVFVPRAVRRTRVLHVHPYPCELRTLSFGLQQPVAGEPELAVDEVNLLDVAILLGLGFDRQGYRLGYGGVFFARFMVDRPFPAVALAFEAQIFQDLPVEAHDLPMSKVVTEQRVIEGRA